MPLDRSAAARTAAYAPASALPDRVSRHSREILGVAYLLAHESVKVHPASIALLNRLLSSPLRSPLFNPQVPEAHVRMALQRVRGGITVQ